MHQAQCIWTVEISHCTPLFCPCAALCAVLCATIKEGHKTIREHLKEGNQDGERSRGQDVWEATESCGFSSPEEIEGSPYSSLQLPHKGSGGTGSELFLMAWSLLEFKKHFNNASWTYRIGLSVLDPFHLGIYYDFINYFNRVYIILYKHKEDLNRTV